MADDDVGDVLGAHAAALHDRPEHGRPEIGRAHVLEGAAVAADGGAQGFADDDVGHLSNLARVRAHGH